MSSQYFESLVHCVGKEMAKESWVNEIRKTYELPYFLPPMHMLPQRKDILKRMHQMYPDDLLIAKELIKEMETV